MNTIRYGSVCSGIEAATCAWHSLGWQAAWFSEIEAFPKAVLAHHYPTVPDYGDMTTLPALILAGEVEAPDLFVGGTPCQSFSVAGMRRGLSDPRGQLARTYVEILDAIDAVRIASGRKPAIAIWENVPGVFSDEDNAFGNFLAALVGEDRPLDPPGGRWSDAGCVLGPTRRAAWRVLDAQYFGLAQRRRRVFLIVGAPTCGVDPVEVLLVEPGVRRDSPPIREARQRTTTTLDGSHAAGGGRLGTGRWVGIDHKVIVLAHGQANAEIRTDECVPTLTCLHEAPILVTPDLEDRDEANLIVRRLTPTECERLQGFPDDYTRIPWRSASAEDCPDAPRYRTLGNSMAVFVMHWIGRRVNDVHSGTAPRLDQVEAEDVADALDLFSL